MKQLARVGLTERMTRAWVRHERLIRTAARTVFRMPGAQLTWRQALWVAILAGPKATVASHLSAAALRGLLPAPDRPHVTVPRTASGRFGGAVVHHSNVVAADRCHFNRVPATSVARTIVDCATLLDQKMLDGLVDAGIGRGLTSYRKIIAAWNRAGPVRAAERLTASLAPYTGGAEPRSEKEAHVLRVLHGWGFPPPVTQYVIRDGSGRFLAKVDFAWPAWRFGLEYLGDEAHPPRAWRHDDRRLARIKAVRWEIEEADRFDLRRPGCGRSSRTCSPSRPRRSRTSLVRR